ncbi:MAG: alpha-amylase family glycosyl hydrolase [Bacteroidetes bacterium]|nr:alpha-amylase family glycosyl hydrolase [Bacteroidota bacterium]
MKLSNTIIFMLLACIGNAQLLSWSPQFIQESSSTIEITCDATLGNQGLNAYTPLTDVYVHIGCITTSSTNNNDWKGVPFTWATTNSLANAVSLGSNKWKFTINGGLRSFFNITNASEKIIKIAILYRSGNGSKVLRNLDGSDMYVPVYDNGLNTRIDNPLRQPVYNLGVEPIVRTVGSNLNIDASASQSSTIKIYFNGSLLSTTSSATSASTSTTITTTGIQTVVSEANNGSTTFYDTAKFFVTPTVTIAPLPSGITKDGIYYSTTDPTVCTLVIYALGKQSISVIGDFNNWTETLTHQMKRTADGKYFWIKLTGLTAGQEYGFQYVIDGNLKVADYNCEKVLDPWNDQYISAATYPNLMAYPTGKTSGIVSVIQPGKTPFSWQYSSSFTRPNKRNLMIYELLVRDFTANHNFQTLKDSLSYLKTLGINAIELMPVMEFEGNNSWGYNPNYFMALDKYYGTETAFKQFIDECHKNGIAVILDIAMNHAFGSCPMVQMYWDGVNNRPNASNPWFNQSDKHPYGVGYDFNHEAQVTKDLVDRAVTHWLTNFKVDGFRWDLSKGFTQNSTTDVGAWGNYDASRIVIWKRIYDKMQAVSANSYCILEHFAANNEEQELSNYGMLLWGNGNGNFREASKGNTANSDFGYSINASARSWTNPHLVGYAESHDEERLMYDNLINGNSNGSYNIKDSNTSLKRLEMAACFLTMVPGPKMVWQMGELGYHYSINTCTDLTINNNCRLAEKPIKWDYLNNSNRKNLYNIYSKLFAFRTNPAFASMFNTAVVSADLTGTIKRITVGSTSVTTPRIVVVGNFGTTATFSNVSFVNTGTWYNLFNNATINVTGATYGMNLQPGEYYVYTSTNVNTILAINTTNNNIITNNIINKIKLTVAPNPLTNSSNIVYELPNYGNVDIKLIDINGQIVSNVYSGFKTKGIYSININSAIGKQMLSKGLYFLQFDFNGKKQIEKLVF